MTSPKSTASYQYVVDKDNPDRQSILLIARIVRTVGSANPGFAELRDYLLGCTERGEEVDGDYALSLLDAGPQAVAKLIELTDRVSYRNGNIYLDGDKVEGPLVRHLVRMVENGDDHLEAYATFLHNLASNPSKASRAALFEWVADRNLTITEDGCFIAYKGTLAERRAHNSGHAFISGEEVNGAVYYPDGAVVSIPRSEVDADRDSACSVGLHVGTLSYARGYSSGEDNILAVKVNPRDVVMVPRDGGGEKMRVCRLEVLGAYNSENPMEETTYVGSHRDAEQDEIPDSEEEEASSCEACGCELTDEDLCPCECEEDLNYDDAFDDEDLEGDNLSAEEVEETLTPVKCSVCGSTLVDGECPVSKGF